MTNDKGMFKWERMTAEEAAELRKLKPGLYRDAEKVRSVSHEGGFVIVLDILVTGLRWSKARLYHTGRRKNATGRRNRECMQHA